MIMEEDNSVSEHAGKMQSFLENVSLNELDKLQSPRILNTHLMPSGLPPAIFNGSKMVVPIRNPKDTAVSMFHHLTAETKGTNLRCDWDTFINKVWFDPDLGNVMSFQSNNVIMR